jgi:hypothetical protein
MSATRLYFAVALIGCGDNRLGRDAAEPPRDSGADPDAPSLPRPPALGAQIDRMGRPAISTALIALREANGTAKTAQKDAYNHAADPATWRTTTVKSGTTIERELERNLAVFDALDRGLSTPAGMMPGCGNPLIGSTSTGPAFYRLTAALLADDQLYVDTSKASCSVYLALEIERATAGRIVHATCGGRMLTHDVIDATYSVLAAGLDGLDAAPAFAPLVHDGAAAHDDVKDTFPFLGPPVP